MTSDLPNLAARLRGQFSAWAASPESALPEADFNALALELFTLQFAANPAYRRLCAARHRTPEQVRDWREIPAVPAVAFKELELSCLAPEERTRVFHSSGTTGQAPARHFHGPDSIAVYEAALWPWFARHLLAGFAGRDWRWLALTPGPALAPHSSLVHMLEAARQRAGARRTGFAGERDAPGAWTVNVAQTVEELQAAIATGEPVLLPGTAFNFIQLLDAMAAERIQLTLPPGSVVMETGGYKGRTRELPRAELHALITQTLGVPVSHIVCEYGMCELSSQGYDRVAGAKSPTAKSETRIFRFPPWCRATVISPETGREVADGETGLVRVLDLANVYSVAAIQTEDLAVRCGNGFELLGRARHAEPRGCSLLAA
jgi:hypothetical protein